MEWANRYNAAIRASGQLLFDWNSFTNDITYAGDAEHFLGYTMREMAGGLDRFREIIVQQDLAAFDVEIQRVTATRDPFRSNSRSGARTAPRSMSQPRATSSSIAKDASGGWSASSPMSLRRKRRRTHSPARTKTSSCASSNARRSWPAPTRSFATARSSRRRWPSSASARSPAPTSRRCSSKPPASCSAFWRSTFCSILQPSDDGTEIVATAHAGWPDELRGNSVPIGRGSQSGYTLLVREPVIVDDMAAEDRFEVSDVVRAFNVVSSVSVVIEASDRPLGVLVAFSVPPRKFVQDDVHFLQTVANVLTAAIERQRAETSIRQAREQAETANRAKSEFLSRMSHELRTPLNAILGFTQLLELDKPTPSQAESIEHISRAGRHLLSLINEVLDIARIEAGRLALSPEAIELGRFLNDALELIRPLAARLQIETVFAPSDCGCDLVLADRQRLKQVFLNLLSNAVKYNRPGGRVTVNCGATPTAGSASPSPIPDAESPPEQMKRLYLPFERLGAEATDIEGTGIGLALSRGIVAALNGELGVESVEGKGSTFWLILPAATRPAHVAVEPVLPPPPPIETEASAQRMLLYIEDQDLNLRLVERILHPRTDTGWSPPCRAASGSTSRASIIPISSCST